MNVVRVATSVNVVITIVMTSVKVLAAYELSSFDNHKFYDSSDNGTDNKIHPSNLVQNVQT